MNRIGNDEIYLLKSCPFCGGNPLIFEGAIAGVSMVVCEKCRATVSFVGKEEKDKTIMAWNRRAENAFD